MRNSRFAIGITSFVLAIAGAFSFKTTNKIQPTSAYTMVNPGCHFVADVSCSPWGGQICTLNGATLYTKDNAPIRCGKTMRTIIE